MTLRLRIAAAAGIAVAITALGLAAADYAGTRSTLRGQIDSALAGRAAAVTGSDGRAPRGGPGDGAGRPNLATPSTIFGDASGFVQQIAADGTIRQGDADDSGVLPLDARARATAKSGSGRYLSDMTVNGVHLRVLTVGIGSQGAIRACRSAGVRGQ